MLIVAPISRVETNLFVQTKLREIQRSHGSRKTSVCTKADDVGKTSLQELKGREEDRKKLIEIRAATASIDEELKKLQPKTARSQRRAGNASSEKTGELKDTKLALASVEKGLLITCRNQQAARDLRSVYLGATNDEGFLPIHFVSSSQYILHSVADGEDSIPVSLEETGIPGLRNYLQELPEKQKAAALGDYLHITLPIVLNNIRCWSYTSREGRQEGIEDVVGDVIHESVCSSISESFRAY